MSKGIYHQEGGDVILDIVEKEIPEDRALRQKKRTAVNLIDEWGFDVVTDAKEGPGKGEFTRVPDPEDTAKKK